MIKTEFSFVILDYKTPVNIRGQLLARNRFLKVSILGREYFLSSLPGFHDVSLEEVAFKLNIFFERYTLNFSQVDLDKKFFNLVSNEDDFLNTINNEMLFHLESILLEMIKVSLPDLFQHDGKILVNELYSAQKDLDFYKNSRCLKIKINPENAPLINAVINELYKINPELIYRLDGNRKFEIKELIDFEDDLKKNIPEAAFKKIDYIEEPLKNFYDSFLFQKRSELKTAIDESFELYMNNAHKDHISVIKPSKIGISPVRFWLRSHPDNRAIISSSFEHPTIMVGLDFLAKNRPNEYHGLESFF